MRTLIFIGALACTVASLNLLEKAQGFLSGGVSGNVNANANANATIGAGVEGEGNSSKNWLTGLQNSSFGQAVAGGIGFFDNLKNGNVTDQWQQQLANSSLATHYQNAVDLLNGNGNGSLIDYNVIQQNIGNSSFGETFQAGIDFFNNLKGGNSKFSGKQSEILSAFIPFLANASSEAQTEFLALAGQVTNMTISDYETAVNAWAAKYQLTAEVEAFNERAVNASVSAEEHANTVVMSLPNVLTNIKAIGSDKNQTLAQMHARIIEYIDSLHEDVKEIVVVLFTSMLPPEFKQSSCKGNFFTNAYNQFFGGQNNGGNNGGFWAGGNGPRIGTTLNLQNGNNASGNGANAGLDGTAHIQILPIGMESDSQVKLAVETESAVTKHKKLQQARNKKNQNKKKKTTTTASPLVDPNPEVNTQVL